MTSVIKLASTFSSRKREFQTTVDYWDISIIDCPSVLQDLNTMEHILDELDRKVNGHQNLLPKYSRLRTTFRQKWQNIKRRFVSRLTQTNSTDSTYLRPEPTCQYGSVKHQHNCTAYSWLTCTSVLMTNVMYVCAHR